jgi:hypothetical protein
MFHGGTSLAVYESHDFIPGVIAAGFAVVCFVVLVYPRYWRDARWGPERAPMSIASRLLFPLFPAAIAVAAFRVIPPSYGFIPPLAVWVAGYVSYRVDCRRYAKQENHAA